jgi:catechol 2,3-dioxygenase-like lactoylglutathione lyase family enzyme
MSTNAPAPAPVVVTINHLNIVTLDLDRTAAFFVDNFGFQAGPKEVLKGAWVSELTGYPDAEAVYVPLTPGGSDPAATRIELLTYLRPASPPPDDDTSQLNLPGYRHIGFVVPDIDALYRRLKDDWRFFSPPVWVESKQLKTVYFVGPERIVIQLIQPLPAPP